MIFIVSNVTILQMKWKEKYNEKNTIVNIKLWKMIGLYQILSPNSPKIFGHNIFHIIVAFFSVYEVIILILCLIGICYWINNISQIVLQITIFANFFFGCYKILVIIWNREKLRKCVKVACNDFIKSKTRENIIFKRFRLKSLKATNMYVLMGLIILFVWSTIPLILNNNYIDLKNLDGTWHRYRLNAFNMFFPVTSYKYNRFFLLFHLLEVVFGFTYVIFSHIFDSTIITMCFAISSQLESICNVYETLGQKYTTKYSK